MKTNKTTKSIIEEIHPGERARGREEDTKRGRGKHETQKTAKQAKTSRRLRAEETSYSKNNKKKQQQNNKTRFNSKLC